MKAWQIMKLDHPKEALVLNEVKPQQLKPGQVRIGVRAAAMNFFDILQCQGEYQETHDLPFTPGAEVSGVILEVAAGSKMKVGERVIATPLLPHGGFTEDLVIDESLVFPIPDELSHAKAASMFITYQTAYYALHRMGGIREGQVLLVHAGSGGVGSAAIQLGKAAGATVIATAGSDEKTDVCLNLGADHAINYRSADFVKDVKAITEGRGAELIFDPVGGDVFDKSRKCIAFEGKILVIGFAGGRMSDAPTNHVLIKNYSVVGVHWGYFRKLHPEEVVRYHHALMDLYKEGAIDPLVYGTYPFEQLPDALGKLSNRETYGKLLLKVGDK